MTNSITFFVLFLLVTLGLVVYIVSAIRGILEKTAKYKKIIARTLKWPIAKGTIKAIEINMGYPWPGKTFEGEEIQDLIEKRNESNDTDPISGIRISYEYEVDDVKMENNVIQVFPTQATLDYALAMNVGQITDVYYNPKLHSESFLIKSTEEDIDAYTWILLKELKTLLIFTTFSFVMAMLLLLAI